VHHRAVHEGGYSVEVDEAGDVRFRTPWGWLMPEVPRAPRIGAGADGAADAVIRLRSANESAGLGIEAWTGTPRGHGERLDLDWAIYVLRGGRPA
jgi:hypothetical protein